MSSLRSRQKTIGIPALVEAVLKPAQREAPGFYSNDPIEILNRRTHLAAITPDTLKMKSYF